MLNTLSQHLENSGAFARLLFVDFWSAFNFLQPIILGKKRIKKCNQGLVLWNVNFLTDRKQKVRVNRVL